MTSSFRDSIQVGLVLLVAGCAGDRSCSSKPEVLQPAAPPTIWQDTLAAIECAISREYGPKIAAVLVATPIFVRDDMEGERYEPSTRSVYMGSRYPAAIPPVIRHVLLQHALPHLLEGDPKACAERECREEDHDPEWRAKARHLDELAAECQREAHPA